MLLWAVVIACAPLACTPAAPSPLPSKEHSATSTRPPALAATPMLPKEVPSQACTRAKEAGPVTQTRAVEGGAGERGEPGPRRVQARTWGGSEGRMVVLEHKGRVSAFVVVRACLR